MDLKTLATIIAIPAGMVGLVGAMSHMGIHVSGWASEEDVRVLTETVGKLTARVDDTQVAQIGSELRRVNHDMSINRLSQAEQTKAGNPIPDWMVKEEENLQAQIDWLVAKRNKIYANQGVKP